MAEGKAAEGVGTGQGVAVLDVFRLEANICYGLGDERGGARGGVRW